MNTNRPGPLIHAGALMIAVALTVVVGRLFSLLIPVDFYFTFESLFSDRNPHLILLTFAIKMSAPLLVGAGFGLRLYYQAVRGERARTSFIRMARRLRMQWMPTLFMSGFFAALLSAWPMIVYWDIMANPQVLHLKIVFYALYVVYMVAFGYIALIGLLGAIYLLEQFEGLPKGENAVTIAELSRVGFLWLISSGIASSAMHFVAQ